MTYGLYYISVGVVQNVGVWARIVNEFFKTVSADSPACARVCRDEWVGDVGEVGNGINAATDYRFYMYSPVVPDLSAAIGGAIVTLTFNNTSNRYDGDAYYPDVYIDSDQGITFWPVAPLLYSKSSALYLSLSAAEFGRGQPISEFWENVRNLSVNVDYLWQNYEPQMRDHATRVLKYRELATRAANSYALETITSGGAGGSSELVPLSILDDMADDIAAGNTKEQILQSYGGAAVAYAPNIQSLIEGTFKTPAQRAQEMLTVTTSLRDGTPLANLVSGHPMIGDDLYGFIMWDRWMKTGMFPG